MAYQITQASTADLSTIVELAGVIWREYYPGIISHAQIEYMLARNYDVDVTQREIDVQGIAYDLMAVDGEPAGFASYGPTPTKGEMKIHKLYLLAKCRGLGYGSALLQHVLDAARTSGYRTVILAVNKGNKKAIASYNRNGFTVRESVVVDIGGGFVMDDYVMERGVDYSTRL